MWLVLSFSVWRDSNPERVSTVNKTVRWTVFRGEVRSGYATRKQDARQRLCGCIPSGGPIKERIHPQGWVLFLILCYPRRDSNKPLRTTVRGDCCLGAATSVSEAIGTGSVETKSLQAGQEKSIDFVGAFFNEIRLSASEIASL